MTVASRGRRDDNCGKTRARGRRARPRAPRPDARRPESTDWLVVERLELKRELVDAVHLGVVGVRELGPLVEEREVAERLLDEVLDAAADPHLAAGGAQGLA